MPDEIFVDEGNFWDSDSKREDHLHHNDTGEA